MEDKMEQDRVFDSIGDEIWTISDIDEDIPETEEQLDRMEEEEDTSTGRNRTNDDNLSNALIQGALSRRNEISKRIDKLFDKYRDKFDRKDIGFTPERMDQMKTDLMSTVSNVLRRQGLKSLLDLLQRIKRKTHTSKDSDDINTRKHCSRFVGKLISVCGIDYDMLLSMSRVADIVSSTVWKMLPKKISKHSYYSSGHPSHLVSEIESCYNSTSVGDPYGIEEEYYLKLPVLGMQHPNGFSKKTAIHFLGCPDRFEYLPIEGWETGVYSYPSNLVTKNGPRWEYANTSDDWWKKRQESIVKLTLQHIESVEFWFIRKDVCDYLHELGMFKNADIVKAIKMQLKNRLHCINIRVIDWIGWGVLTNDDLHFIWSGDDRNIGYFFSRVKYLPETHEKLIMQHLQNEHKYAEYPDNPWSLCKLYGIPNEWLKDRPMERLELIAKANPLSTLVLPFPYGLLIGPPVTENDDQQMKCRHIPWKILADLTDQFKISQGFGYTYEDYPGGNDFWSLPDFEVVEDPDKFKDMLKKWGPEVWENARFHQTSTKDVYLYYQTLMDWKRDMKTSDLLTMCRYLYAIRNEILVDINWTPTDSMMVLNPCTCVFLLDYHVRKQTVNQYKSYCKNVNPKCEALIDLALKNLME